VIKVEAYGVYCGVDRCGMAACNSPAAAALRSAGDADGGGCEEGGHGGGHRAVRAGKKGRAVCNRGAVLWE